MSKSAKYFITPSKWVIVDAQRGAPVAVCGTYKEAVKTVTELRRKALT